MRLALGVEVGRHGDGELHLAGGQLGLAEPLDEELVAFLERAEHWRGDALSVPDNLDVLEERGLVLLLVGGDDRRRPPGPLVRGMRTHLQITHGRLPD